MVHGIEKFKEYFRDHTHQYVFIGGTACDILMEESGGEFRTTKDLDVVLIIEALDSSFGDTFWEFIEDGGYQNRGKNNGEHQFYRFTEPRDPKFPKMIELFSKQPNYLNLKFDNGLTPIHIDDSIVSLSAILLDESYYNALLDGKKEVNGYSLIEIETIILFKIKAWLDMKKRIAVGEQVDSKNIKKHKNDIFRLLAFVTPSSRVEVREEIRKDIMIFNEEIRQDIPDLKNLGIRRTSVDEMLIILNDIFLEEN